MKKYIILFSGNDNTELEVKVDSCLAQGWELQGGISYDSKRGVLIQAMIKNE